MKFLVKVEKPAMETFQLLTEAYGEECMSCARVFEQHKRISEGTESVKDNDRPGQGTVMAEWVPTGQTVNQQYYLEVLTKLREHVRKKRSEL
jgi:hypothetical protein